MQDEYAENTFSDSSSDVKRRIQEVRARLEQLAAEQKKLVRELHELHLAQERIIAVQRVPQRISDTFPPEKKIRIFRSLFRGREDVFPRRFESTKTGKSGYQPVCVNKSSADMPVRFPIRNGWISKIFRGGRGVECMRQSFSMCLNFPKHEAGLSPKNSSAITVLSVRIVEDKEAAS